MHMRQIILALFSFFCLTGILACGQDTGKETDTTPAAYAEVGRPAPDFTLKDTDGKEWKLAELRGKVVFINFWATWCPPCREEMPSMEKLKQSLPPDKFVMVTILSKDNPTQAADYVKRLGATYPVLIDSDGRIGAAYGITGVPETYIVAADGILREKFLGPRVWDSPWGKGLVSQYIR